MKKCKEIPLTQGKVAIIDAEDYEYLNQWKWYALRNENIYYAIKNIKEDGKWTKLYMHREIMKPSNGVDIDHINGNGWDNRRDNLRLCNRSQNKMNGKMHRDNTSGYKRVCWNKLCKKWQANIQVNWKQKHLGLFNTKEQAATAYNEAAIKLFGKYARLNALK